MKKFRMIFAIIMATVLLFADLPVAASAKSLLVNEVSTTRELKAVLKEVTEGRINIVTGSRTKIKIPVGDYSKIDFLVDAPKATISNRGRIKSLTVGETGVLTAKYGDGGLTIKNYGEITTLKVKVKTNLTIAQDGTIGTIKLYDPANLNIKGSSTEQLKITVKKAAKDAKIVSSVPAKIKRKTDKKSAEDDAQSLFSAERLQTMASIKKLTDYDELNIYTMEVFYDYNLDNLTPVGMYDNQAMLNTILEEAMPGVGANITAPQYGCSAFTLKADDGKVYMGRNYDFRFDSSAMQVYCHPKDGYASVGYAALDNLGFNDPFASSANTAACLAAPFVCLDGMNEKGVSIAVLTLSSEPTAQKTGKPVLATPILIRMVLDRAATTKEAIDLIAQYDCFATSGRDYHYYITDASGDGVVVEWDCEKADRPMVVTPLRTITNYYAMYEDQVEPYKVHEKYGRGRERRDHIEETIEAAAGNTSLTTAWDAAKSASQKPDPTSIVSNTQWTVIYNNTDKTHEFVLHRNWDDVFKFDKLW